MKSLRFNIPMIVLATAALVVGCATFEKHANTTKGLVQYAVLKTIEKSSGDPAKQHEAAKRFKAVARF